MKRGIYDADLILHLINGLLVYNLSFYLSNVLVVDLFPDDLILACRNGRSLICGLYAGQILNGKNLLCYALVVRRCKLCAVLPVYLVAVVLRRIMAGSDVDACHAAQLADSKGQLRCGAQGFKLVCLDSVGCQSHSRLHGKFRRHMAGVIGNGYALVRSALLDDVVCQSLCGPSYYINIHAVDSCSDDSPKACGPELQIHVKTLFDLVLIAFNGL